MPFIEIFSLLVGIVHTPILKPAPVEARLMVRGASFCWARPHGNNPERLPAAAIRLRLDLLVSYRNSGQLPLVVPRTHESAAYIGISPSQLYKAGHVINVFAGLGMRTLSNTRDDEFDKRFTVIAPGAEMSPMLAEEVELTVYNPSTPAGKDWRGSPLFVSLEETQQPASPRVVESASTHGSFWTGKVRTTTVEVRIPDSPLISGDCR